MGSAERPANNEPLNCTGTPFPGWRNSFLSPIPSGTLLLSCPSLGIELGFAARVTVK